MDNDMLCFKDIKELDDLSMDEYALRVVKHNYQPQNKLKMYGAVQTVYPRKNWSSLMIMNCEKLTIWSKRAVSEKSGAFLHRFQGIPDSSIGEIPKTWNSLDCMDEQTALIHYTNGGPWFEEYTDHPHADKWYEARREMMDAIFSRNYQ